MDSRSAAELYKIRTRMDKGRLSKAQRWELYTHVVAGYVKDGKGRREDPDETCAAYSELGIRPTGSAEEPQLERAAYGEPDGPVKTVFSPSVPFESRGCGRRTEPDRHLLWQRQA